MLTIVDINRAIDRLGVTAFVPQTQQRRIAAAAGPRAEADPRSRGRDRSRWSMIKAVAAAPGDAQPALVQHGAEVALEPEIVLPEQLENAGKRCTMPEHRLMLAVMEDAVHTYLTTSGSPHARGRALFRETAQWFASDDTSSPFCFVTICQLLGLDPDYLRAGLRRWREQHRGDVRAIPLRIRHGGGSRHRVIESRASRRRA